MQWLVDPVSQVAQLEVASFAQDIDCKGQMLKTTKYNISYL